MFTGLSISVLRRWAQVENLLLRFQHSRRPCRSQAASLRNFHQLHQRLGALCGGLNQCRQLLSINRWVVHHSRYGSVIIGNVLYGTKKNCTGCRNILLIIQGNGNWINCIRRAHTCCVYRTSDRFLGAASKRPYVDLPNRFRARQAGAPTTVLFSIQDAANKRPYGSISVMQADNFFTQL